MDLWVQVFWICGFEFYGFNRWGFKFSRFYGLVGLNFFGYNGFMASNSFRVVIWISFRFDVFRCALKRLKSCHWWGKDLLRWGQNLAIDGAPTKVHCSTRNRTTSLTQKNLNQPRKLDFFCSLSIVGFFKHKHTC